MSRVNRHSAAVRLQRSLTAITIGSRQAERKLQAELAPLVGGDVTQAIHVPVTGKVTSSWVHTEVTVGFTMKFLSRILVDEDDVEPTVPTFTYGVELQSEWPVIVQAFLRDWIEDDSGLIVSARVRLGWVGAPGWTLGEKPVAATMHLQFTGYAAPEGDDDDQGAPVPVVPESIPQPLTGGWEGTGI